MKGKSIAPPVLVRVPSINSGLLPACSNAHAVGRLNYLYAVFELATKPCSETVLVG